MVSRLLRFLKIDIWNIPSRQLSGKKSFFLRQLKMILLAAHGVWDDRLQLRASALTYYTLLAIVPIMAMAFAIAKGFGFESMLERQLLQEFPGQEEVLRQVVTYAHNLLERTRGGMMAGIGVIFLFWAAINVLGQLERSLNDIWDVKKSRSIWRKFSDYLTIMVLSPVLVILSSSVTVYIKTQVTSMVHAITLLGGVGPLILSFLKLLPFFIIWMLFTLIYLLMPNTKIRFLSALLAGFIAGGLYQVLQYTYINFQFLIAKYNAIYGSFAALPLFLIWLYLSWMIVLFGAEVSFAHQNVGSFESGLESRRISFGQQKLLALMVSHLVVRRFVGAEEALTMDQLSRKLEIPIRLVHSIVRELTESRILTEVASTETFEPAYQPAVDTNRLSMAYIVSALEKLDADDIPVVKTAETQALSASLERFQSTIDRSPDNLLLRDLK